MPVTASENIQSQKKELPFLLTSDDCDGKTFVITGAYSGIGYETAKHLVELQAARVIIAVRDLKRGEEAKASLERATGRSGVVEVYELDLSSFDSVKAFIDRLKANLDRVDALIANAAIGLTDWREVDGYETQLRVNLVSNVLLMALIVPFLQDTGKKLRITPRIIFVGTVAPFLHPKPLLANVDTEDIVADLNDRVKWESSIMERYVLPLSPALSVVLWKVQSLALLQIEKPHVP